MSDNPENRDNQPRSPIEEQSTNRLRVVYNHLRATGRREGGFALGMHQTEERRRPSSILAAASGSKDQQSSNQTSSSGTASDGMPRPPKKATWLDSLQMNPKLYWPRKYRYTLEPRPGFMSPLSKKQRDQYEDYGYLVIRDLVPQSFLRNLRQRIYDRNADPYSTSPTSGILMDNLDQALEDYCRLQQIVRLIEAFCGENIMAMQTTLINAPNQDHQHDQLVAPEGEPLHQDLFYLPFRPADRIVCCFTALEPCLRTNGCPTIVQSTHRSGHMQNVFSDWQGYDNKVFFEPLKDVTYYMTPGRADNAKYIELRPGDTLFYHPLLVHGMSPNLIGGPAAKGFTCHYASSECEYVDVTSALQQSFIPPHMTQMGLRSGLEMMADKDVWMSRGKIVKGKRINL